jgi:hypothetical protein
MLLGLLPSNSLEHLTDRSEEWFLSLFLLFLEFWGSVICACRIPSYPGSKFSCTEMWYTKTSCLTSPQWKPIVWFDIIRVKLELDECQDDPLDRTIQTYQNRFCGIHSSDRLWIVKCVSTSCATSTGISWEIESIPVLRTWSVLFWVVNESRKRRHLRIRFIFPLL